MFFRKYFVIAIMVILLIWGPIDDKWTAWFAIRLGYLVLIPTIVWFLLNWIWDKWNPNTRTEDILERALSLVITIFLLVMAIFEIQAKTHLENDHWIRTREGMEAVGDDILVKGPDYGHIFILVVIAICVFWFGVLKKKFKSVDY
jgi:hypothetical protein